MLHFHGLRGEVAALMGIESHAQAVDPAFAGLRQARALEFDREFHGFAVVGGVLQFVVFVARQAELVDRGNAFLRVDLQRCLAQHFLARIDLRLVGIAAQSEQGLGLMHHGQHTVLPAFVRNPHAHGNEDESGGNASDHQHLASLRGQGLAAQRQGHFHGGFVALACLGGTGGADHVLQSPPDLEVCARLPVGGQVREVEPVLAGAGLVQDHAQAEDVRGGGARSFGGHEALRSHEGALPQEGYEPDVCQRALSVDVNQVGGLDVAVNELVAVEVVQPFRHTGTIGDALLRRQPLVPAHLRAQGVRTVGVGMNVAALFQVVREFHHVVVEAFGITTAHLKNGHEPGVLA